MRQPRDDGTINNTLTEIALFLLFTFGVAIAISSLEAGEQQGQLRVKITEYEYYLYGPPSDMRVLTTIRRPEKGAKSPKVFVMTGTERSALDTSIIRAREKWAKDKKNRYYDTNPCFVKTVPFTGKSTGSKQGRGEFVVKTESTDVNTGATTQSKSVVLWGKSVSAFGIFVAPDVSTTNNSIGTPPIYFEAQPRLEIVRDNYYPTKDIHNHKNNKPKNSLIKNLNIFILSQKPTTDINKILLSVGKFMRENQINCTFQIDILGVIYNSSADDSISTTEIQRSQHDCSTMSFTSTERSGTHFLLSANKRIGYRTRAKQRIYKLGRLTEVLARAVCEKQRAAIGTSAVIELPKDVREQFPTANPPRFYWNSIKAPFDTETIK
jgi:hypothetical protein